MNDFFGWLHDKHLVEFEDMGIEPADRFSHNPDTDRAPDREKTEQDLVKVLLSKYQREFMSFITQLGEEHRDREIQDFSSKLKTDVACGRPWRPDHASDKDRVVPPEADRGMDPNAVD